MLDVHPPHTATHGWRDFLLHIFTITIGLLIALGLEAGVEAMHHRHLLHQAEANLHAELSENRDLLARDERQLTMAEAQFAKNLDILRAVRMHSPAAGEPAFHWYWSGMQSAAWTTARDTGAIALMPYEDAHGLSIVYGQQDFVDKQAEVYIADIYRAGAPLEGGRTASALQPAEVDAMIANTQQTLADIQHLRDLAKSLDVIYSNFK